MTVKVFVVGTCPHCAELLADLERRGVAADVIDVGSDPSRQAEMGAFTREMRVPVMVDHERVSIGFRGRSTPLEKTRPATTQGPV